MLQELEQSLLSYFLVGFLVTAGVQPYLAEARLCGVGHQAILHGLRCTAVRSSTGTLATHAAVMSKGSSGGLRRHSVRPLMYRLWQNAECSLDGISDNIRQASGAHPTVSIAACRTTRQRRRCRCLTQSQTQSRERTALPGHRRGRCQQRSRMLPLSAAAPASGCAQRTPRARSACAALASLVSEGWADNPW